MSKTSIFVISLLAFIFLFLVGGMMMGDDEPPKLEQPRAVPTSYQAPPKLPTRELPKKLPTRSLSQGKKSTIDINVYQKDIVSSVTYNTMGHYDLPDEIDKKLKLELDTVIINSLERIKLTYKNYKINILASDTSGIIMFQKIE